MTQHPPICVVGADSLIGSALCERLNRSGQPVLKTSRRPQEPETLFLDLRQDVSAFEVPQGVSLAFFCAAVNSLEECRREPLATAQVNVTNTVALASRLCRQGARIIFLSTNLVFDGTTPFTAADTVPAPRTQHGRQKAEAEQQLSALADAVCIIRLTKIIGPQMRLLQQWIAALDDEQVIHPLSDKVFSPLSLSFAVDLFARVIDHSPTGILQVSADRDVTYAQLAHRLAERMGVDSSLVQPVSAQSSGLFLEHLPRHTTLDCGRVSRELDLEIPGAWATLDEVISQNLAAFEVSRRQPAASVRARSRA